MCLAVPGKILDIQSGDDPTVGRTATVEFQGSRIEASLAMTPQAAVGDWVLIHAGFALTVLDEDEARETFASLREALGEGVELPGGPESP
jgi:hydrogenase expression/formation protein HypC